MDHEAIASRLAHDATAACRQIRLWTSWISEDGNPDPETSELLAKIDFGATRLANLIRTAQRLSAIEITTPQLRQIELIEVCELAMKGYASRQPLPKIYVKGEGTASADPKLLAFAIDALIENAYLHDADDYGCTIALDDNTLTISNPSERVATEQCFDALSRNELGRLGLGLALVRRVMEKQGGSARPLTDLKDQFGVMLKFRDDSTDQ